MARDTRLDNFEASVHLTNHETNGERWSLAAIDKQIARREDDSRIIPQPAMRLDLRSLARLNYKQASANEQAGKLSI